MEATITNEVISATISNEEVTASVSNESIVASIAGDTTTYIYGDFSSGTNTGDILRWNATNDAWEVAAEPLAFKEIVLTPSTAALSDVEGGMYYRTTDKSVLVCTSDT